MSIFRKYMMKYLWHRYKVAYRARRSVLSHTPREVWVEPTNRCNLRCVMCPQSKGISADKGFMDIRLYEKLLAELKKLKVQRINLFLGGESLLHRGFADMLSKAKEAKIPVRLHTNATLLTESIAEKILASRALEEISFSFDAEDKDYYERVRVNASYDKTLANIRRFLEMKKARGLKRPKVIIQVLKERRADGAPPAISEEFKALFAGLPVERFKPILFHNFGGTLETSSDVRYEMARRSYRPCTHPWKSMSITWDGKAVGCCSDLERKLVLGDATVQGLKDIWHGEAYVDFRRKLAEERYREVELCRDCDHFWR